MIYYFWSNIVNVWQTLESYGMAIDLFDFITETFNWSNLKMALNGHKLKWSPRQTRLLFDDFIVLQICYTTLSYLTSISQGSQHCWFNQSTLVPEKRWLRKRKKLSSFKNKGKFSICSRELVRDDHSKALDSFMLTLFLIPISHAKGLT